MPPFSDMSTANFSSSSLSLASEPEAACKPLHESNRRLNVTFAEYDDVAEIPHINDMSDEEFDAVYYSEEELHAIRTECKELVRMINKKHISIQGKCVRGLDQHTAEYSKWRKQIRTRIYDAVFEVQDNQEILVVQGTEVSELIARISRQYSSPSASAAQKFAITDAARAA